MSKDRFVITEPSSGASGNQFMAKEIKPMDGASAFADYSDPGFYYSNAIPDPFPDSPDNLTRGFFLMVIGSQSGEKEQVVISSEYIATRIVGKKWAYYYPE